MDKWLENFPRPPFDNGRGLHWSPNQYFWGQKEWSFWADLLERMDIKWVKIMDDGSGSAIGLIKRLLDLKIMPVIRLYREQPNPGRINGGNLEFIKRCVDYGAPYFETNNEPDLDLEWENRKRPENWLNIVVDNFVVEASQIREVGGYLLFPAFGPGGRGNPFQMIAERGRKDLLDGNCCLAIHNYCLGRPLDYPNDGIADLGRQLTPEEWEEAGGMWAWEMGVDAVNEHRRNLANPDINIMNDSTCFRAFEYFDKLVNDACGHSIPIMTTEGGYNVGQRAGTTFGDDARYPKPTPFHMSQLTDDMFRYIEKSAPDYYFSCMVWVAGVAAFGLGAANFENQGPWITNLYDRDWGLKGQLPVVEMLEKRRAFLRTGGEYPTQWDRFDALKYDDIDIDYRLRYLEPEIVILQVIEPTGQYWKLTEVKWQDPDERPSGNIFVRCLNEAGEIIEGQSFVAAHGQDKDVAYTKGEIDNGYGDVLMTAGLGTYDVYIDENSDLISGLGMGTEIGYERTSFFLTFQLTESEEQMPDPQPSPNESLEEKLDRIHSKISKIREKLTAIDEVILDALNVLVEILEELEDEN